jgi:hypothetical protein
MTDTEGGCYEAVDLMTCSGLGMHVFLAEEAATVTFSSQTKLPIFPSRR